MKLQHLIKIQQRNGQNITISFKKKRLNYGSQDIAVTMTGLLWEIIWI